MAHTDKTDPARFFWSEHWMPLRLRWRMRDQPQIRRRYNRKDRHDAKNELRHGREPEPRQPRGRALYDLY